MLPRTPSTANKSVPVAVGGGCRPRLVAVRTDGEFTEIAEHGRHVVEQLERHVVVREFGEQHLGVDVDEA